MGDARAPLPTGTWRQAFSALRNPNYRYFYFGQTLSLIGTWTRSSALGWIAYQFTHSAFLLGVVFMLNTLPLLVFSTYAGALADRLPKIRIFTFTSWFSLASSASLGVMLFLGPVHIAYLMVFALLWGLSTAFEMPARQTLMVERVGKQDLVNAIALNSAMVNSTRVVGPAVGALLIHVVGAPWCFLLDAFSYLAVLYGLGKIKLPASHYTPARGAGGWDHSLVQTQSPDHLRGRLMGIWALVFGGGMPLGSFWMGLIAQHTTSGFALQMGGALCAVGAVVVYVAKVTALGP